MKWQYEAVDPSQPPVVLLLHYRTREELMQILAPPTGQAAHAHAMMRAAAAAAAAAASISDPGAASAAAIPQRAVGGSSAQIAGFCDEFNGEHAANYSRMPLDDDDIKIGLRRTFSNSSCGSFSSDAVFKSESLLGDDLSFGRRRSNHLADIDDVPSASHLDDRSSKPSPMLLSQSSPNLVSACSPVRGSMRDGLSPQLTSPGTFLSVPTP
jgi:hypothetical protein